MRPVCFLHRRPISHRFSVWLFPPLPAQMKLHIAGVESGFPTGCRRGQMISSRSPSRESTVTKGDGRGKEPADKFLSLPLFWDTFAHLMAHPEAFPLSGSSKAPAQSLPHSRGQHNMASVYIFPSFHCPGVAWALQPCLRLCSLRNLGFRHYFFVFFCISKIIKFKDIVSSQSTVVAIINIVTAKL